MKLPIYPLPALWQLLLCSVGGTKGRFTLFTSLFLTSWFMCICLLGQSVFAQTHRTCATVERQEQHSAGRLPAETREQFEDWLKNKIEQSTTNSGRTTASTIYTIPVVVHVVHNGEAIGTGTNISDAQIKSQIRILNEDYRRKDATRGYNTHPDGADAQIEFKLALTDPDRFPTSGIVRVRGTKQTWSPDDEDEVTLKALSYWPAENYLNIWVCNLGNNTLGYAQFPESGLVQGISAIGEERDSLDGVVIGYKYFGDEGTVLVSGNDFRYGRTTTHEVGHFLGLRHTWGDPPTTSSGCSYDDYCADTPNTRQANYDCPANDSTTCTTPKQREMVENYMDYTDDACMNVFTEDQVLRMRIVLENSPRRASLLSSPALSAVSLLTANASVEKIASPEDFLCQTTFSPVIILRNYGTSPLTMVKLQYKVNDRSNFEYTWTGNLATAQRDTVALPLIQVNPGRYTLQVNILTANEVIDEDSSNNNAQATFQISTPQALPFWENFERAFPQEEWIGLNEDNDGVSWRDTLLSSATNTPNKAAYLRYYQSTAINGQDVLLTAPYDLSTATQAFLLFEVAYARRNTSEDELRVMLSLDCGNSFSGTNILYQKTGSRLATGTTSNFREWSPSEESHWRTETINLSAYLGQKAVRFAFTGINKGGNNIYLDNVRVVFRRETTEEEVNGYRELARAFKVYPNPSGGKFNLLFDVYEPRDVEVSIFNIIGQEVFKLHISQAQDAYEVDLSDLPAGMYLVQASGGNEKITKKLIITHSPDMF